MIEETTSGDATAGKARPESVETDRSGHKLNAVRGLVIASLVCLAFWFAIAWIFFF